MAEAAATTPDRVTVHCVHQHNAPFACLEAQEIVSAHSGLPPIVSDEFLRSVLARCQEAVAGALSRARRVTHVSLGLARVEKVASSRRILGADGKLAAWRASATTDPQLRVMPEGLIDPWLRTIALHDGEEPVVACHYYATHPMSYYGDGRVTSDFAGLARKRRQAEDPGTTHIYFTGCAGDIAAGKYNDGSPESRLGLTERLAEAIVQSERGREIEPLLSARWRTEEVLPPVRAGWSEDALLAEVADRTLSVADRNRAAFKAAWLRRQRRGQRIVISALELGKVTLLHLPAECFVAYQLQAQSQAAGRFVATAAYGDGGPWYMPTRAAYAQGGYEVSVAFCDPGIEDDLTRAIQALL
jgi:hypothetical protein